MSLFNNFEYGIQDDEIKDVPVYNIISDELCVLLG